MYNRKSHIQDHSKHFRYIMGCVLKRLEIIFNCFTLSNKVKKCLCIQFVCLSVCASVQGLTFINILQNVFKFMHAVHIWYRIDISSSCWKIFIIYVRCMICLFCLLLLWLIVDWLISLFLSEKICSFLPASDQWSNVTSKCSNIQSSFMHIININIHLNLILFYSTMYKKLEITFIFDKCVYVQWRHTQLNSLNNFFFCLWIKNISSLSKIYSFLWLKM